MEILPAFVEAFSKVVFSSHEFQCSAGNHFLGFLAYPQFHGFRDCPPKGPFPVANDCSYRFAEFLLHLVFHGDGDGCHEIM
jgi:hypothetical protein